MKMNELLPLMQKGGAFMLGEYRGGKAEAVNYRDKLTGKTATFESATHVIEVGNEVVLVQEFLRDGKTAAEFKPMFPKGQKVLVSLYSYEKEKGTLKASGSMTPVEA